MTIKPRRKLNQAGYVITPSLRQAEKTASTLTLGKPSTAKTVLHEGISLTIHRLTGSKVTVSLLLMGRLQIPTIGCPAVASGCDWFPFFKKMTTTWNWTEPQVNQWVGF